MSQTLHLTASVGVGLLLGWVNWLLWSRWGRSLLQTDKLNWGLFFLRSFVKVGFLGTTIWILLSRHLVDPVFFLIGFSCVVIFVIVKGFKCN
ncbi:MAG: hypothetical protein Q7T03_10735 [Deltaproteobacteria bacterium]|nr:hypothetical protein [Deltaproteobacteria bacterium]